MIRIQRKQYGYGGYSSLSSVISGLAMAALNATLTGSTSELVNFKASIDVGLDTSTFTAPMWDLYNRAKTKLQGIIDAVVSRNFGAVVSDAWEVVELLTNLDDLYVTPEEKAATDAAIARAYARGEWGGRAADEGDGYYETVPVIQRYIPTVRMTAPPVAEETGMSTGAKVAIGVGGVTALGLVLWLIGRAV